ncbi:MAG: sirohydrochlorin chelatase [Alphaproteobacteria bacterium]
MTRTAVLLCGHGSRDDDAIRELARLAARLGERLYPTPVDHAFLEFARPVIRDRLEALSAAGAREILAIPGMLFAAGHAKNDIPSVLGAFARARTDTVVHYGRELAIEPKLINAAAARIEAALKAAGGDVARRDTLLVVVGRGTSDPDANGNVAKVARMLWEGMGFGWAEVCYSGVTAPRTEEGFARAARMGFGRIVVFPYFLFTGVLVKRIYQHADQAAAAHPGVEFIKAHYLDDHPLVVETFADRVREIGQGLNLMNCLTCKYREQIVGYEDDVGQPQAGHHHHVEGIGTDGDHHEHDGHHDHDNHHHHNDGHNDGHRNAPKRVERGD